MNVQSPTVPTDVQQQTLLGGVLGVLTSGLAAWSEQFDGSEDQDLSVSGADLVMFFAYWRGDLKVARVLLNAVIVQLEARGDEPSRALLTLLRGAAPAQSA